MAVFTFEARDTRGELVAGTINAESITEASRQLRNEGKYVLEITRGVQRTRNDEIESIMTVDAAKRVKRDEVIDFCQQLSVMIETGVPLIAAIKGFNQNTKSVNIRRITQAVEDEVSSGSSLSAAMARWPRVFPPLVVSLIEASEASGTMGLMLNRIAKYLTKEMKTAKQIRGALTYPCVMMTFAMAVTVFLMTFVLPRFASIYANRSAALPTPTKILMAISSFWSAHWIAIIIATVVGLVGLYFFVRTALGKRVLDWLRLNTPVLRNMYQKLYLTRAARTMSTLIAAGVDLLETIRITRGVTDNMYYKDLWNSTIEGLEGGMQLSDALKVSDLIPGNIIQMINAGERAGRLGPVMERIGEVTEEELDEAVTKTTQFIEPAMITIMGAVIGFVAISLLLPIFTIANAMK
ncbi:MAG: type II secretion system F family protein [Phycisphaerales bacterium]